MFKAFIIFTFSISLVYADDLFEKKEFERPLREVSIIVTDTGYYPNKIMAFKGERVRFFVTATGEKSKCFILQKHELFLSADQGRVNEGEVDADKPGRFKFFCPSTKHEGYLTVYEKFKEEVKPEKVKRDVASEKPNYWLPRNYD